MCAGGDLQLHQVGKTRRDPSQGTLPYTMHLLPLPPGLVCYGLEELQLNWEAALHNGALDVEILMELPHRDGGPNGD